MTTIARLLTIVAMTLPLGACAAQPAVAQAPAAAPVAAAVAAVPPTAAAAQPVATQAQAETGAQAPAGTRSTGAAGAAAPAAAAPAAGTPAADSSAPALSSVPAADTPRAGAAGTTAPETTVGGGAANRVPAAAPVTMPAGPATGSLLQTLFALIVVLGVLGALAWFLKRYGPKAGGGTANLRVVGSLNLGGRERLLVVEVGSQWIVVGASPGRVNALATMPKQEGVDAGIANATLAPHTTPASSFGDWLKQTIDKRK